MFYHENSPNKDIRHTKSAKALRGAALLTVHLKRRISPLNRVKPTTSATATDAQGCNRCLNRPSRNSELKFTMLKSLYLLFLLNRFDCFLFYFCMSLSSQHSISWHYSASGLIYKRRRSSALMSWLGSQCEFVLHTYCSRLPSGHKNTLGVYYRLNTLSLSSTQATICGHTYGKHRQKGVKLCKTAKTDGSYLITEHCDTKSFKFSFDLKKSQSYKAQQESCCLPPIDPEQMSSKL